MFIVVLTHFFDKWKRAVYNYSNCCTPLSKIEEKEETLQKHDHKWKDEFKEDTGGTVAWLNTWSINSFLKNSQIFGQFPI